MRPFHNGDPRKFPGGPHATSESEKAYQRDRRIWFERVETAWEIREATGEPLGPIEWVKRKIKLPPKGIHVQDDDLSL